ncbi:YolD-like family protein [Liberiplasma polymorphum]|uniref:YolD-like family protein n=1 Tax=Liberiplasma polymorphum TaxID=3374570 RepID=UPI003770FB33
MGNLYMDRKMLKWLPFQSLPEQGDEISSLLNGRAVEVKPELSEDQYMLMQYRFEEAFINKEFVTISYFKNGKKHTLNGVIIGADIQQKIIMLNTGNLFIEDIIAMT